MSQSRKALKRCVSFTLVGWCWFCNELLRFKVKTIFVLYVFDIYLWLVCQTATEILCIPLAVIPIHFYRNCILHTIHTSRTCIICEVVNGEAIQVAPNPTLNPSYRANIIPCVQANTNSRGFSYRFLFSSVLAITSVNPSQILC